VIAYTVKGAWKYKEQDWIATPGSVVFEPAAISHQPETIEGYGDEVITLNITLGDTIHFDESGNIVGIENWRTGVARYLAYCKANNIPAKDVTSFVG
jgi:2,4'-dihydroxyacetophenone dioxygenase